MSLRKYGSTWQDNLLHNHPASIITVSKAEERQLEGEAEYASIEVLLIGKRGQERYGLCPVPSTPVSYTIHYFAILFPTASPLRDKRLPSLSSTLVHSAALQNCHAKCSPWLCSTPPCCDDISFCPGRLHVFKDELVMFGVGE